MITPVPRAASALALATALACAACSGPSGARQPVSAPSNDGEATTKAADASARAGAEAAAEAPAPEDRPHEEPPPASAETRRKGTRTIGWVALAIGAEATAVAIGTSVLMLHAKGSRNDGCDAQKRCNDSGYDSNDQLKSLGPWNAGAWIVGAAGLGIGTWIILATSPSKASSEKSEKPSDKNEARAAVSVSPSASGLGLQLRSTF